MRYLAGLVLEASFGVRAPEMNYNELRFKFWPAWIKN